MGENNPAAKQEASDAVEAAHKAFAAVSRFDQETIDRICSAMAARALSEAERLGRLAHEETGFGKAEDKREKNRFAAEDVWDHFKSMKTVGVINDAGNVVEIASPRGVVAAIIPSTNPTSTAIFKIIIAIKSRNSIALSPHPSAAKCIIETARVMRESAIAEGLPGDAIKCLESSSLEGTETLMKHKHTAVILATGGLGLVRAAYSSGKPAFGVGPGNVPVFIERSADVKKAVADILTGTCFDNGTICASEQAVVVDAPLENAVRAAFTEQGGHFLNSEDAAKVAAILLTPERTLNAKIVGKSPQFIADLAGITIPAGTRCLLADCGGVGREYPWSVEKLSPTLAFFVVDGVEAGAAKCEEILRFGGMGHTAGMHTQNREAAVRYGNQMPASRVVINSPTTHGAIGLSTDLSPSMTLGCGSWGGNVTSDNISPIHLMDIKRVAFESKPINRPGSVTDNAAVQDADQKRKKVADLVDRFLNEKLSGQLKAAQPSVSAKVDAEPAVTKEQPQMESPVRTIIHELRPQTLTENGIDKTPVDFVSENDVRDALNKGSKIYINSKTILTPSARDLGEEKDVFARV